MGEIVECHGGWILGGGDRPQGQEKGRAIKGETQDESEWEEGREERKGELTHNT